MSAENREPVFLDEVPVYHREQLGEIAREHARQLSELQDKKIQDGERVSEYFGQQDDDLAGILLETREKVQAATAQTQTFVREYAVGSQRNVLAEASQEGDLFKAIMQIGQFAAHESTLQAFRAGLDHRVITLAGYEPDLQKASWIVDQFASPHSRDGLRAGFDHIVFQLTYGNLAPGLIEEKDLAVTGPKIDAYATEAARLPLKGIQDTAVLSLASLVTDHSKRRAMIDAHASTPERAKLIFSAILNSH